MKLTKFFFLFAFTFVILTITGLTFSSFTLEAFAEPGSGTLFGTDAFNARLISINPSTGDRTVIGTSVLGPSLAVDPATGIMYATSIGGVENFYSINTSTAAATLIGPLVNADNAVGLDFRSDGVLFATAKSQSGKGGKDLATINTSTGLLTIIGSLGVEKMGAIAFASDGTLYGATESTMNSGGSLYTINTTTGVATFEIAILDSDSNPHPGGFSSIQFGCDGTLYYGGGGGLDNGGDFGTINIITGVYTQINSSVTTGSLGGLAFQFDCDQDNDGVELPLDCDDTDPDIFPGATEIFGDGIDNNCDGNVDEGFTDVDGDGFVLETLNVLAGFVDCDDGNIAVNPGATDTPSDDVDDNCSGFVVCYDDADSDAYGTSTSAESSFMATGGVADTAGACGSSAADLWDDDNSDCNDVVAAINPGATEVLDGVDNNCDGNVDEGFTDPDGDLIESSGDNCPNDFNPSQSDIDVDSKGDACDVLNVITVDTIVSSDFTSLGNLIVQGNSLLTINSGVTVTIQSGSNITIQSGSGVLIKSGGTLQINS